MAGGAVESSTPGAPALLLTDLYYLDHYGNSAHFPGHAVVLAGYDDEVAYLSDTAFDELQTTRLENLARARHGKHPIFPLAGQMLTAARRVTSPTRAPPPRGDRAQRAADDRAADGRVRGAAGVAALRRRGRELAGADRGLAVVRALRLPGDRAPRHRRRQLPAHVLALSRRGGEPRHAGLAAEAAERWTGLAAALLAASEADEPESSLWREVDDGAQAVLAAEERLWPALLTPLG